MSEDIKKFILHVGLDKTGTTSLQQLLASIRMRLLELSICYPASKMFGYHHLDFAAKFGFSWSNLDQNLEDDVELESYLRQFDEARGAVILSSEHFSYYSDIKALFRVKEWLLVHFPRCEVKIVIFLRNQVDWFMSLFGEGIKWGVTADTSQFFDMAINRLDFKGLYDDWSSVFGCENVTVIDYDVERNTIKSFMKVASKLLNVQIDPDSAPLLLSNQSPSQLFLEAIRFTNLRLDQSLHYDSVSDLISNPIVQSQAGDHLLVWGLPKNFMEHIPEMTSGNIQVCKDCHLTDSKMTRLAYTASVYQSERAKTELREIRRHLKNARRLIREHYMSI